MIEACSAADTVMVDITEEIGTTEFLLNVKGRVVFNLDQQVGFSFIYNEEEDCYRITFFLDREEMASFSPCVDFQQVDYENRRLIKWIENYVSTYLKDFIR